MRSRVAVIPAVTLFCAWAIARTPASEPSNAAAQTQADSGADPFAEFLRASYPVADGFGDPWEAMDGGVAEAVLAVAHGRVVEARESSVVVEHTFYENHLRRVVRSLYSGLREVEVSAGELVSRGQRLGLAGSAVELAIIGDESAPEAFIAARRQLFVPQKEAELVILHHGSRRLQHYRGGQLIRELRDHRRPTGGDLDSVA